MPTARVQAVAPGSPAAEAGVLAGDELLTINGEAVRDVIRYHVQADDEHIELEVRRGGLERAVTISKEGGAPLGLELSSPVFDRVRTCDNHCPFCFIYQLPKGMRSSLYVKDDDYRLSFLYGNFTTLTRFTEADLERVISERLGPLYVSIHATDPPLRARLLRNARGATSLRWLRALLDADVEVHGQVVVCPGVNDGLALEQTLLDVLEIYPRLATIGLVPLGVSAHTTEAELRAHAPSEAVEVLDITERWQARYVDALGRRLVFAADEYYLLAGRRFPALDEYEGTPQHENGIGMARTFAEEVAGALAGERSEGRTRHGGFFASIDGAPSDGYRAPRQIGMRPPHASGEQMHAPKVALITGAYGDRVLRPLLPELERATGVDLRTLTIENSFFGGNIAVTGLLTGADVARALSEQPHDDRYLLPDVVLSNGRFLDGTTVDDLPRAVDVIPTTGASLVAALR